LFKREITPKNGFFSPLVSKQIKVVYLILLSLTNSFAKLLAYTLCAALSLCIVNEAHSLSGAFTLVTIGSVNGQGMMN
tara:strand:- start:1536 stop:1769 length:234 start_codon:yes stop_codon:yes gene_type:complete